METIIDMHSHILPGVDDGSASLEESLGMLVMEAEQGIRRVAATPHFYARHDSLERFLKRREGAWENLRAALENRPELPIVELGAEVRYFAGMSNSDALSQLTIGGGRYLLLEMPAAPWTETMYREMEAIYSKQGITPIIAHVDRYISPLRTHGIPKQLSKLPVLVQANAGFFLRPATARMALRMLKADQIHLLGSDCHNLKTRAPNLGPALKRIEDRLGEAAVKRLQAYGEMVFAPEDPA